MLYATLGKLPCMLPHSFSPEHLVQVIRDNDADIRAVAVSVYHLLLYSLNVSALILSHFSFYEKTINLPFSPFLNMALHEIDLRLQDVQDEQHAFPVKSRH